MADKKNTADAHEDMMTELLLKEADEALRQEKMQQIWQEWGSTIIGVAFMLVFGTMVGVGWQSWRNSVYKQQTAMLVDVKDQGVAKLANTHDELSGRYKAMADLMAASELTASMNDQNPQAVQMLHDLMVKAEEAGLPDQWDVLAQWGALRTKADLAKTAEEKLDIANEMADLGKGDNAYRPVILMESATLYGSNGNSKKAVTLLEQAKADKATQMIDGLNKMIDGFIHLYKTDIATAQENDA